ncbi:MAG: DUF2073 domain-containing protein [Candidatus Nanohaloarchaeota archaeon QJJ-5]|nr:DUF2073 domain-containing protein [Candidatus Nanohaloarchaeota archaeon QJJ-5]
MADDGIPIEFISKQRIQDRSFDEKLQLILEEVRDGKILVLGESLGPEEKRHLIEGAMQAVDEEFPGIEFSGLENNGDIVDQVVDRVLGLFGKERKKGLTIVGNSDVMEKVKEDKETVSLLARAEDSS